MKEHNDSLLGKHIQKSFSLLTSRGAKTHHIYIPIHQQNNPFFVEFLLCDYSMTAKSLVARLMEVDQDQRLTAQEAINHEFEAIRSP